MLGTGTVDFLDLIGDAALPARQDDAPASSALRVRQNHHFLARTLAEGRSNAEASALTGYCPGTISRLKADPTFQELLEYYRIQVEALKVNWEDRIGALAGAFLDEMQHRLECNPESFSNKELREAFAALGDRSMAPSKSKQGAPMAGPAAVAVRINFVPPSQGEAALPPRTVDVLDLSPAQ